jgi:hypothetical protein
VFPVVTEVRWGNGLDEFNRALPTGSYFPDGTTEICVSWTANNFDVGAPWSITWSYEGAVDPALGGAGTVASTIDPYFACVFNDGGVFPGLYEMVWRVNEQVAFVDNLYVGGGRPPVVVTMINGNDLPICRLNVSPSTAEFWGRDVLDRATIDVDGAFDVTHRCGPLRRQGDRVRRDRDRGPDRDRLPGQRPLRHRRDRVTPPAGAPADDHMTQISS